MVATIVHRYYFVINIAECGGSPLLANDHLSRCGFGLAEMEGLIFNMGTYSQSNSHAALPNAMRQGVVTWPSTKVETALWHGERVLRCG